MDTPIANDVDAFTRECIKIRVARRLRAVDEIDLLSDLFILRGVPGHVRSDNGSEFIAKAVQEWVTAAGAKTAYIAPGSPWGNGHTESFNAWVIISAPWYYNAVRPHASLGYRAPAPEVTVLALAACPAPQTRPAPPATLALEPRPTMNQHSTWTTRWGPTGLPGKIVLVALSSTTSQLSSFECESPILKTTIENQ